MSELPRPLPESYWVVPGRFLAGEYPSGADPKRTRRRLEALLETGFDTFIDLTRPDEREPYQDALQEAAQVYDREVRYRRFSIGDFGLPTREAMRAILNEIESALADGRRIYLHCRAGIGRTGTTVGCYLVDQGHSGQEALEQLTEWWQNVPKSVFYPRSPETDEQAEFILHWKD